MFAGMRLSFSLECTKLFNVSTLFYLNSFPKLQPMEGFGSWNLLSNPKTLELFLQTAPLLPRALLTNGTGDGKGFIIFSIGQCVAIYFILASQRWSHTGSS